MIPGRILFFGPLTLAAAGLTACGSLFGGEPVKIRPIENMSSLTPAQSNPLYESAVTAINARDYARALDYLQEAKAKDPRDIKMLNALGVIYDKLGRFDLSARYYAQARAVDPNSRIVATNMGYSEVLQHLQGVDQHSSVAVLEAPDDKALPEVAAAKPSSPEAITSQALTAETQPVIAANAPRSVDFAPAMQPVESPVVIVSIAPNVVAAPDSSMEKKPLALPGSSASAAPVAHPAEKQMAALTTSSRTTPETKGAAAASNPPTVAVRNVSVEEKSAEVPPVHAASIAPVIRPAAIETETLLASSRKMAEMKGTVVAAPNLRAAIVQNLVVENRLPQATPLHFASVAPVAHLEQKQAIAIPVRSVAKPVTPATEGRPAIPIAFHPTAVPAVPVKAVLSSPSNGKVLTLGKPVNILNASGQPGGVGPVSHRLTMLGWSIKQSDWRMQPATTLYYPVRNIVAAKAMLRTLPFPARLMLDNNSGAFAMRLVIGRDFLSWKPRNARLAALWQKGQVVASLQKPLTRGVR